MTSYVSIPNGDVDQDSPVTQPLLTALRDNPIAIAEGDVTAPKVQRAAIQDAAINRVKLSTGTNSGSYSTGSGGGFGVIILDAYSFFPSHSGSGSVGLASSGSVDAPRISWSTSGTGSGTVSWRYVLA